MKIAVASGKGGTGKTLVATNLALSLPRAILADCDVEAPNANIFLNIPLEKLKTVVELVPQVDQEKCTHCGECERVCQFNAIVDLPTGVQVFPDLCHGCGLCATVCPTSAITEIEEEIGSLYKGETESIVLFQGLLKMGKPTSSPIIAELKDQVDVYLQNHSEPLPVILDSPPGTACPVITALHEVDFALLVTEPTAFGLHDLTLAVQLVKELQIPCGIIINRSDPEKDQLIEDYATSQGVPILAKIPFDKEIARAYARGIPLIKHDPSYRDLFLNVYEKIQELVKLAVEATL